MIDYADKDRDGKISYQEFVDVVTKEYPQVWFFAWYSVVYDIFFLFILFYLSYQLIVKYE